MTTARESVRIVDWLASRSPQPPDTLSLHLKHAVGNTECDRSSLSATLINIAEEILPSVGNDRQSATRLLVADALITYAMEAAAEECGDVEQLSRSAAHRISSIAK